MTYPWWTEVNEYINKGLVHSIHTSERLSRRGCRRRAHWVFDEGYYPIKTPDYFEFGVAFHEAMRAFYDPLTWNDRETAAALAITTFKKAVKAQQAKYVELTGYPEPDPEVKADYEARIELGIGMLRYYTTQVSPYFDKGFRPIKVEVPFEVPILDPQDNPVWCKCNICWRRWKASDMGVRHHDDWQVAFGAKLEAGGLTQEQSRKYTLDDVYYRQEHWKGLPLTYGGRIDMLAEDDWGTYWPFDWKTTVSLSSGDNWQTDDSYMLLDDQITSYCWALWLLGKLNGGEIRIGGFVYAQIKKAFPTEPEPLKHNRQGRWYSINKQQHTDHQTYLRTVSENDTAAYEAGLYDDFLAYLEEFGSNYHMRHQVRRSEIELQNAGHNIYLEALDIIDPNKRIYPSPGRFSCSGCAFQGPCLSMNRGEDYQYALDSMYIKREHKYWELQPSSTDKKARG